LFQRENRFGTNGTTAWNKVFAWPPAKNWHRAENWLHQNWSHKELASRSEPNRAGPGTAKPRPACAGQGVRGVLGNTLLGLAGDRLTRCNMGPRNLDQTIEDVQERQSAIGRFLGKDHERLSH
jgi:hypothetical protein